MSVVLQELPGGQLRVTTAAKERARWELHHPDDARFPWGELVRQETLEQAVTTFKSAEPADQSCLCRGQRSRDPLWNGFRGG
eukprot:scaffold1461_cov253-Pinguiococcus_pyrenoidosus.AAC.22